jgi:allophanate hydrolase subunit 2
VLGSCATVVREALGGLDGQGCACQRPGTGIYRRPCKLRSAEALRPQYAHKPVLDLVMGAQIGDFSGPELFDAFNMTGRWTVAPTAWASACWGRSWCTRGRR